MKIISKIVLFLFLAFLSTPTIIFLIEKDKTISLIWDLSEKEELQKELKEIKVELSPQVDYSIIFLFSYLQKNIVSSKYKFCHDNVTSSIFSPPPELN